MKSSLKTNDSNESLTSTSLHHKLLAAIEKLKFRLQARYEEVLPGKESQVREIIGIAETVAWQTPYPHLFLPELAEEGIARFAATQADHFANQRQEFAFAA